MVTAAERRRLGAVIRGERVARGLSQRQLGTPLSRGYVSAIELGRFCPSLPALVLFARRLDVPLTRLLASLDERQAADVAEA